MDVLEPEDTELVQRIRKNLKDHASAYREWRRKAKESYDFVASEQWTDEEKQALQDSARTPIVFNRVARTINAVTGLELQNRQEVTYKPITIGTTPTADVMNSAAKWVRSNCDAEDEESEAFSDSLICGIGATETLMDYTTNLDGMVVVERMDPFECAADPYAKKRNFDDMRWCARWKGYSKEEFEDMYPGIDPEGSDLVNFDETDEQVDHNDDEYKHGEESEKNNDKCYTVVKYQYYEEEQCYRVQIGQELKTISKDEYAAVGQTLSAQGIQCVPQMKRVYKQVVICRDTILENTECPIDGFTMRFITGLRDRNRNCWFGLVELMKDPQRWANKWLSQIQFIINSNAKGGLIYEANTFTNPKKAKADWAKPNSWIEVVKGAVTEGRLIDRRPPAYPDGIDRLLQQALTAINDVPGVNVEMLGLADRNQPGMVEDSRKNSGVTNMASFFDSLRRYRKEQGRVLKQFILNFISDGRLIRIDGANAQYVPLNREAMADNYDILVDDAPTSANMKEKTFSALSQMLGVAMQAGIPVPPEVLEYSPLPAQLVEKWMKTIEEKKQVDPEKEAMKSQMAQMAEQLKAAVAELEDKTEETQVKARADELKYANDAEANRIKQYEAETARMKSDIVPQNKDELLIKAKELELKERELALKEAESQRQALLSAEEMKLRALEIQLAAKNNASMQNTQRQEEPSEEPDNSMMFADMAGRIMQSIDRLTSAIEQPKYATFDTNGNITVQ